MLIRNSCLILVLFLALATPVIATAAKAPAQTAAKTVKTAPVNLTGSQYKLLLNDDLGERTLQLIFEASGPLTASSRLSAPDTLTLDFNGILPGTLSGSSKLDGLIAEKLTVSPLAGGSRVEIKLTAPLAPTDYRLSFLAAENGRPARLQLEIDRPVLNDPLPYQPGLRGKVIVIDPGHGGSDPGAHGSANVQEKDVNLAVSLKLAALLEKEGAVICMTRQTDRDVYGPNASGPQELGARTAFASFNDADLFISIHSNWFSNPDVNGSGSYYYGRSYYSRLLAKHLQRGMSDAAKLKDRGIYTANFYVLKHSEMPACLLELGFLSNKQEEKQLASPQVQDKLASGIASGLKSFFEQASQLAK